MRIYKCAKEFLLKNKFFSCCFKVKLYLCENFNLYNINFIIFSMKKKLFLAFLMPLFVFTACNQFPDELNITINTSGYVTVKAVADDGSPIVGATVEILSGSSVLLSEVTNASGSITSGKLLQGFYRLDVSFTVGELTYRESKGIQVIAGETMTFELNPLANAGNVNIQLLAGWDAIPEGLNVVLIPSNVSCNFDNCVEMAHFNGKIDFQHRISFENIPVGWYQILAYNDANGTRQRWWVDNNSVRIERDRTTEHITRAERW